MKVLVTGATGFVGQALTRRCLGLGMQVSAAGRNREILDRLAAEGARALAAELGDAAAMRLACQGREAVFHCGALSSPWGKADDFYRANVSGTANVIAGCKAGGVSRLVYVSTPSIYSYYDARLNVREDAALPAKPANLYVQTKLLAEEAVRQAAGEGLKVITLRPRAVFGPGDNAILPRLIQRLQRKQLPILGDGKAVADLTYIDNLVDALLLCLSAPEGCLGKVYNISNGEPVRIWEMIRTLCERLELEYPRRHVPYALADGAAWLMERIYGWLPGQPEPPLTRYMLSVVGRGTTLDITAARRELGYQPAVSVAEGLERFVRWWKAGQA
jgi:nucleoside-diphosphate-sugar epimerase